MLILLSAVLSAASANEDGLARASTPGWSTAEIGAVPAEASAEYSVGSGDVLDVRVLNEDDLTGAFVVEPDGSIRFPLLGNVYVAGMSPQQVAATIARRLDQDYLVKPQVFVQVGTFASQPVEVTGLVQKPAVYHLDGPTTLRELLARAGGIKDETITEVEITREAQKIVVRYEDLYGPGGDLVVRSGDQIHVPQGKAVYVLGQVGDPGSVAWRNGLTLTQALTNAGGLDETARINKVYILRDGLRIEVHLKRILKGKEADFVLQPEDQVFIDQSRV
jgi:polysaccharide export outer membrane protein